MRVIGACIRVIRAGSAPVALGRATFNPLVQGSTPWRPTRKNTILIMAHRPLCRCLTAGHLATETSSRIHPVSEASGSRAIAIAAAV